MNRNPIKPSVPRNMALGTMLNLLTGAAAGLLRDRMDHVFHHAGEVKDELGLPLLGHIPTSSQGGAGRQALPAAGTGQIGDLDDDPDAAKQRRYQRFFYQEAFRNLFTSIRFLNSDQPLQSIALTSSLPAEQITDQLLLATLSEMGSGCHWSTLTCANRR